MRRGTLTTANTRCRGASIVALSSPACEREGLRSGRKHGSHRQTLSSRRPDRMTCLRIDARTGAAGPPFLYCTRSRSGRGFEVGPSRFHPPACPRPLALHARSQEQGVAIFLPFSYVERAGRRTPMQDDTRWRDHIDNWNEKRRPSAAPISAILSRLNTGDRPLRRGTGERLAISSISGVPAPVVGTKANGDER
jgi:hypothetical protein